MNWTLLYIAAACALIDWLAVWRGWRQVNILFKPATLIFIIAWFVQITQLRGQSVWFGIGLVFALIGDACLLFPNKLFLAGLAAFLVTQLTYAFGFNPNLPPLNIYTVLVALILATVAIALYRLINLGLARKSPNAGLQRGVQVYSIAIYLMAISAVLTIFRPEWSLRLAWYAAIGGMLFFFSDSLLAIERFVRRFPYGRVLVIVLYHTGQILLVAGVARHVLID